MTRKLFQFDLPTLRSLLTVNGAIPYGVAGAVPLALALGTKGRALFAGATSPIYDPVARRNLIINGGFSLAQRGTALATVADNAYGPDRWRVLSGAGTAPAYNRTILAVDGQNYFCAQVVSGGGANKFGLFTVLEGIDSKSLSTVIASLQAKIAASAGISDLRVGLMAWSGAIDNVSADPVSAWNAVGTNPTLIASWTFVTAPVTFAPTTAFTLRLFEGLTIPAGTNNLGVLIWADDITHTAATDYIFVGEVQLEQGSVCTEFERETITETYLKACRYFCKSYELSTTPGTNTTTGLVGSGNTGSGATSVQHEVAFPVLMRTAPTLAFYGKAGVANQFWKPTTLVDANQVNQLYASNKNFAIFTNTAGTDEAFFHYTASAEL